MRHAGDVPAASAGNEQLREHRRTLIQRNRAVVSVLPCRDDGSSADYINHEEVFDDIAARNVFSDEDIASRIEAFRSEHRSRFYYDIDRPGRDFAMALHDLAEQIHQYLVEFADAHSRCSCDHSE